MTSLPVVAAFDFDGTISYHDTLLPFLFFIYGPIETSFKILLKTPSLLNFVIDRNQRQNTKEAIFQSFFKGMSLKDICQLGDEFAKGKLNEKIRPLAIKRLDWHLQQGHRCILISASLDVYLKPWSQRVGFQDLISSRFEINSDGNITGKLLGKNCWGPEKVRRLKEILGPNKSYTLYAYGDSRGDKELLEFADYSWNISNTPWEKI